MRQVCFLQVGLCATAVVDAQGGVLTGARGELELGRTSSARASAWRPVATESAPHSEEGYQLGDCFFDTMGMRAGKYGQQHHKERWPNSLAVAYMERTTAAGDYRVLTDLVRTRGGAPPATSLVVHLRTGDVLDQAGLPLRAFLGHYQPLCWQHDLRETGSVYAQPLNYYENIVVPPDVKDVVVVASTAYHSPWEKAAEQDNSRQYIKAISDVFVQKGYRVTERLNGDADQAFLFCAQARHFVPSGGGFSTMAASVVERLGGTVLGEPLRYIRPYDAVRLCLHQGLSLTGLLWSVLRTGFRMVAVEHLRVLSVGARLSLVAMLACSAGLWAWASTWTGLPGMPCKPEGSKLTVRERFAAWF